MSKARTAGTLGALILSGLLLLSSFAVAGGDVLQTRLYFAKLQSAFLRACGEQALRGELRTIDENDAATAEFRARVAFFQACVFVVRALRPLTPPVLVNTTLGETEEALLNAFRGTAVRRGMTCDQCVEAVADLEVTLATNGTAPDIGDALAMGCERRFFSDPAKADQCLQFISPVPELIDFALANLPPETACQELQFCPLP